MLRFISLLSFLCILIACERIPMEEYALPEYDGALTWTEVSHQAEWPRRYDHAAVAFQDKLWIFGGYNPGQVHGDTYYEDIWNSGDGVHWELVMESAPWKGRRGHRTVTFDDGSGEAIYLLGGFAVDEATGLRQYANDVWRSRDGIRWEAIKPRTYPALSDTTDWMPRMHPACITVNHNGIDYIYIIGGRTQLEDHNSTYASVYFNDVWRSADGILWEKLPNNDYGIRAEQAACVDPSTGRIYMQGGSHGVIFDSEGKETHPLPNWQYLWYSDDGIQWNAVSDSISGVDRYLWRSAHNMVYYDDKLWVLPGKTVSNMHYHFTYEEHYATWTYAEREIWEIDSKGAVMDPRHSYPAVLFDNKIWIFGGFTDNRAQNNDVWTAQY